MKHVLMCMRPANNFMRPIATDLTLTKTYQIWSNFSYSVCRHFVKDIPWMFNPPRAERIL